MSTPATQNPWTLLGNTEESDSKSNSCDFPSLGLDAILALGQRLGALEAPDQVRPSLLDSLIRIVDAERGFLLSWESQENSWEVKCGRSFEGEDILNPSEKIILDLVNSAKDRDHGYFTADLESEKIYPQLERSRSPRTRSVLILPLPGGSEVLYLDHRFQQLAVSQNRFYEFAWLYTVLVAQEAQHNWQNTQQELSDELRKIRKKIRSGTSSPDPAPSPTKNAEQATDERGIPGDYGSIVGQHSEVLDILRLIARVAPTMAPVLINGESGTGKELIALAVHKNSERAEQPFISENCAALAENLLEAELFGCVKGAYTGAHEDRAGLFEQANGGTLFLDEIGDTSPGLQKKLLRVLQEGTIRRVGGQESIQVDVRILSATNRDLFVEVSSGRFREDLLYRLNVITIQLPALRDRRDDVPLLVEHFIAQLNTEQKLNKKSAPKLLSIMMAYDWPGNIRELQNEVRRAYALGDEYLLPEDLSPRLTSPRIAGDSKIDLDAILESGSLKSAAEVWEQEILRAALERFQGNKARLSAELKIPKTTLYTKLKRYGLLELLK